MALDLPRRIVVEAPGEFLKRRRPEAGCDDVGALRHPLPHARKCEPLFKTGKRMLDAHCIDPCDVGGVDIDALRQRWRELPSPGTDRALAVAPQREGWPWLRAASANRPHHPEIVLGMLIEVLRRDPVASGGRVSGERQVARVVLFGRHEHSSVVARATGADRVTSE